MPLNQSKLKSDLEKVFEDMKDGSKDDRFFADGVAKAFKDFAEMGMAATTDTGAVAAGAFVGAGTGTPSLDDGPFADMIYQACQAMAAAPAVGTDQSILAPAIANGFTAMLAKAQCITTTVTGVATPPPPAPPVPLSGQGKGNAVVVPATLLAAAMGCFASMYGNDMGDGFMAEQLAVGGMGGLSAGIVNTQGQGPLTGAIGVGTIA